MFASPQTSPVMSTHFPYTTLFRSPLAIRAIKQSLKSIHEVTLSQGLKLERQHFVWLAATQDRQEGINAFLEKRKRSEEHTSELQSRENLVCRLLLEKKNKHR